MIWRVFAILMILWFAGMLGHVGGTLIHILPIIAIIVLIADLFTGRRSTV
jgi:hypothetical protein